MATWAAKSIGTNNVGTRTSGRRVIGSIPGMSPRMTTIVAVPTATTRSSTPKVFQARYAHRCSVVRGDPLRTSNTAPAAAMTSPQPAPAAKMGDNAPRAPSTRAAASQRKPPTITTRDDTGTTDDVMVVILSESLFDNRCIYIY